MHSVLDERDAVGLQAKCRRAPLPRGSECGTAALAGRLDLLRAASESEELPAVLLADLKRDATVVLEVVAAWDHMFLSEGVSTLAVVLGSRCSAWMVAATPKTARAPRGKLTFTDIATQSRVLDIKCTGNSRRHRQPSNA